MNSKNRYVWLKLLSDIGPVVVRNVFSLVSIIIGALAAALILLGQTRNGVFIASVVVINIFIGIIQELRARYALEKLQLLNRTTYQKIEKSKRVEVSAEDIMPNDNLYIKIGDQIPVDCEVLQTLGLEVSEALLTGESDNVAKKVGNKILGGSVVVAGNGVVKALSLSKDSFIGKMGGNIKQYHENLSPIQKAILSFIRIMVVILLFVALLLLIRNSFAGTTAAVTITQTAALAATIIAEGLLLASTVLFAYGAIRMGKQKVLLQQITAAENLGRIQFLCIDKTGTLTINKPEVDEIIPIDLTLKQLKSLLARYISASDDSSEISNAISKSVGKNSAKIIKTIPFSSVRKYSLVKFAKDGDWYALGAPEKILQTSTKHNLHIQQKTSLAKRVLVIAKVNLDSKNNINKSQPVGLIVLNNPLKKGVERVVKTLQDRQVSILVLSGDNPNTVRAVAKQAGIIVTGSTVTGDNLIGLANSDYEKLIRNHSIFARISPEQKRKLVIAAQSIGVTAMVGDGANDALAIKKADIGIAMYEGASITRQIADVVLLDSSFSAIPDGIKISDSIITTLEMIAIVFFTRIWSGLFIFAVTLVANLQYPFTPRNITVINYFIIGFPIILWGLWPRTRKRKLNDSGYLKRTLPFSILNGVIIAFTSMLGYFVALNMGYIQQAPIVSFWIFLLGCLYTIAVIPKIVGAEPLTWQDRIIRLAPLLIVGLLLLASLVNPIAHFFDLQLPSWQAFGIIIFVVMAQRLLQFGISKIPYNKNKD